MRVMLVFPARYEVHEPIVCDSKNIFAEVSSFLKKDSSIKAYNISSSDLEFYTNYKYPGVYTIHDRDRNGFIIYLCTVFYESSPYFNIINILEPNIGSIEHLLELMDCLNEMRKKVTEVQSLPI